MRLSFRALALRSNSMDNTKGQSGGQAAALQGDADLFNLFYTVRYNRRIQNLLRLLPWKYSHWKNHLLELVASQLRLGLSSALRLRVCPPNGEIFRSQPIAH